MVCWGTLFNGMHIGSKNTCRAEATLSPPVAPGLCHFIDETFKIKPSFFHSQSRCTSHDWPWFETFFSILASLLWLEDEANMQSWFWRHTEFFYPKNVGIAQWANITKNDTSKARQLFGFIFWETILNLDSLYFTNVPESYFYMIQNRKIIITLFYLGKVLYFQSAKWTS